MARQRKRKQVTIYDPSHGNLDEFFKANPMDNLNRYLPVTEIDGVSVSLLPNVERRGLMVAIEPTATRSHELHMTRPGAVRNAVLGVVHAFNERLNYKGVEHSSGEDDAPCWYNYEAKKQWDSE